MRGGALVTLILLTFLAGCVAPAANVKPASATDIAATLADVKALMAGVPCEAKSVGAGTSENVKVLTTMAFEDGGRAELDPWHDLIATGWGKAVDVLSVRDPLHPVVVAHTETKDGSGDTKWLGDGKMLVVAHGRDKVEVLDASPLVALDGTIPAEPLNLTSLGVWTYPAPPAPRDRFTNMHMLEAHTIGGDDWFLVAPNDDTGVWMVKVVVKDGKAEFEAAKPIGAPLTGGPLGPHDMTVRDDEILKKPVLWIANGFEGWEAFDVSDPKSPKMLAIVPNLDPGQGYTHTIDAAKIGNRRIVVTIAEVGVNMLKVYDATDLQKPTLLGEWWADKADPHIPQHDINILDGKLYVAHYVKGVYVFDLTKLGTSPLLETPKLAPVAHLAPAKPGNPGPTGFANVFDAIVVNGVLYMSDFTDKANAITVAGYGCLTPGVPMQTVG